MEAEARCGAPAAWPRADLRRTHSMHLIGLLVFIAIVAAAAAARSLEEA